MITCRPALLLPSVSTSSLMWWCVDARWEAAAPGFCGLPAPVACAFLQCVAFSFKWLPTKVIEMWPRPRQRKSPSCLQHTYALPIPLTCLSWQHLKELNFTPEGLSKRSATCFYVHPAHRPPDHFTSQRTWCLSPVFCCLASWFRCARGAEAMPRLSGLILTSFSGRKDRGSMDGGWRWVIHAGLVCNKYLMPSKNTHIKDRTSMRWHLHLPPGCLGACSCRRDSSSIGRFPLPFLVFQLNFLWQHQNSIIILNGLTWAFRFFFLRCWWRFLGTFWGQRVG